MPILWESSALSPVGSLSGSQQQLGGWAQCALAPRAAYCLVRVRAGGRAAPGGEGGLDASAEEYLHKPTKYGRHLYKQDYGVCLPASCSRAFARLFLGALLAHGPYGAVELQLEVESCEVAGGGTEFTMDFYLFVIAAAALIIFVALCTVYTQYVATSSDPKSSFLQLARCFSVPDNYRLLFEAHPDEIPELNGIRFVTSAGVVMLHSLMLRRAISNGVEVEQMIDNPLLWWLLQTDLLVETFFTMSGFLLVRSALARPDRGGLWRQVVRRYCRLAPAMLAVVWALSSAFLHAGAGPLWPREAGLMVAPCRRTWWLAELMLGNCLTGSFIIDHYHRLAPNTTTRYFSRTFLLRL
ncbi:nose resistant to fluoxetine protein 6-like [Plutella xylostella]|uniref:nose resistant to fluoxetine protein 6-like n=1 Tax=Plutella xylostella TaxID=51655 RepID=UPI0020324BCE|nr:nose resistant to fluoxetine protein 6-like [Plutella xylostella]